MNKFLKIISFAMCVISLIMIILNIVVAITTNDLNDKDYYSIFGNATYFAVLFLLNLCNLIELRRSFHD